MVIRYKKPRLTIQAQAVGLKRLFPNARLTKQMRKLTWEAEIKPSPSSQIYTVQMTYSLGDTPKVYVLKPELIAPEGQRLPHTYRGNRLCLYFPKVGEWTSDQALSLTIVPWISEWLLYYEIWLATGKWCGGGEHPPLKKE